MTVRRTTQEKNLGKEEKGYFKEAGNKSEQSVKHAFLKFFILHLTWILHV